jgi:hypothetical protein
MNNNPDLSALFQAAPNTAGMMMGQQFASAQQSNQLADEQQRLQNEQTAAMNPLNQQYRRGEINQQAAQLGGFQADSDIKGVNARVAKAGEADNIQLAHQKALSGMSAEQLTQMGQEGQKLSYLGAQLESVPPMLRTQFLQQRLSSLGIDPNGQVGQTLLADPSKLATIGKSMALSSAEHIQKRQLEDEKLRSAEKIGAGNNSATIQSAQILANSRLGAAQVRAGDGSFESRFGKLKSAKDKHAALIDEAQRSMQNGDTDGASQYLQRAATLRPQAEAEINAPKAGTPNLPAMGLPANPTPSIAPPSAPATSQQGAPDVGSMAQQSWGAYEPNKYEYRVGPNGNLQRKPK